MTYTYVGPEEIRRAAEGHPEGALVRTPEALEEWLLRHPDAMSEAATFVVDLEGSLRLAPRRSEHVACAGGEPVLAAGEIRFARGGVGRFEVVEVTNQSTGYCPDSACWPSVAQALTAAGVPTPKAFTTAFTFRRCTSCGQINLVKEEWFVCAMCESDLPREWNFQAV
jgi:hypothetical protein